MNEGQIRYRPTVRSFERDSVWDRREPNERDHRTPSGSTLAAILVTATSLSIKMPMTITITIPIKIPISITIAIPIKIPITTTSTTTTIVAIIAA